MNKVKVSSFKKGASLSLLAFIVIVSIVEVVGPYIVALQSSIIGALSTGVCALVAVGGTTLLAGIDWVFNTGTTTYALSTVAIIFTLPAILSVGVFCLFCSIAAISPRGKYGVSDIVIAFGVMILESLPFVSGFIGWAGFAYYLKVRETVSGVTDSLKTGSTSPTKLKDVTKMIGSSMEK